ncbi:MAG TPA: DUF4382 domain-containing protein [Thiobacillaceae bacterium]|nr:DUF4382 domain-containing protein [Thiobacillaceae bacterium]
MQAFSKKLVLLIASFLMAMLVAGCGGGGSGGGGGAGTGTLNVLLTDSPACGYDHVYITVDHVEISPDGNKWTIIPVSTGLGRIDLLSLTNGALLSLGVAPLSAGTYQQVRLVLKANGNAAPWANSVVLSGAAAETALKTPSGQQSGYKIIGPFTVQAGTQADLVLDFNACKSIVVAGASGQYLLKPVVRAIAQVVSGSITGTTLPNSQIYAEQQSSTGPVIVSGAVADSSSGAFTLSPILESSAGGNVDVVIVPPAPTSGTAGFATDIVQDVPVTAGGTTSIGTLTPAAATINTASGTVTVSGAPGAANLVADQTVTSTTRTYEITATATTTGPYAIPLAASGPWLGTYSTTLPIALTQDTAAADAGIYSISATDAAGTSLTQSANVSAGSIPLDFTLAP